MSLNVLVWNQHTLARPWIWRCPWSLTYHHSPGFWHPRLVASLYLIYITIRTKLDCSVVQTCSDRDAAVEANAQRLGTRNSQRRNVRLPFYDHHCSHHRTLQGELVPPYASGALSLSIMQQGSTQKSVAILILEVCFNGVSRCVRNNAKETITALHHNLFSHQIDQISIQTSLLNTHQAYIITKRYTYIQHINSLYMCTYILYRCVYD